MSLSDLGGLLKKALKGWHQDGALRTAAALAYYAVFSVAPLLVIVTFLVGLVYRGDTLEQVRTQFADFVNPQAAAFLAEAVVRAGQIWQGGVAHAVVAGILLLLGASVFAHEARVALDTLWNVRPKNKGLHGVLLQRLWALLFVIAAGIFLQASALLNLRVSFYRRYVNVLLPGVEPVWRWLDNGISFLVLVAMYCLSYKLLPSAKLLWRDVAGGAFAAAVLFSAGKWVVGLYALQISFTSVYGAAGSLMVLLVWLYYCSLVFLFGAKFTQTWAEHFGRPIKA